MVCLCVSFLRDAQVASDPPTSGVDKSDMEDSYRRIWDEIGAGIRPHVSGDAFQRWFATIGLVHADELALTFEVPNTIYQLWIESNYLNLVEAAALAVLGSPRQIKFRVSENGNLGRVPDPKVEPSDNQLLAGSVSFS